jgi:hypothetical protein
MSEMQSLPTVAAAADRVSVLVVEALVVWKLPVWAVTLVA